MDSVHGEDLGAVTVVTLARPQVRNAVDGDGLEGAARFAAGEGRHGR